jgi:hypothetical protein
VIPFRNTPTDHFAATPMFFSRNYGTTHFLAVASATMAVVGFRFDDVKWAVSVAASLFGSAVALYIFRGESRAHTETLARVHAELERLRFPVNRETKDLRRVEPPTRSSCGHEEATSGGGQPG